MADEQNGEYDYALKSVAMTVKVLREIAAAGGAIGVTQLARQLNESKARIHRHLLTLKDEGLLTQEEGEKYNLGWALFDLGQAVASRNKITDVARPFMEALSRETGLSVYIGLRDHHRVVVADSIDSERPIAVTVKRGIRLPARASATGRVLLAYLPDQLVSELLEAEQEESGRKSSSGLRLLRKRLQEIRSRGYDWAEGESQYGVNGIAAPVVDSLGHLLAVVGLIGTQLQITSPPPTGLTEKLLKCAKIIGERTAR